MYVVVCIGACVCVRVCVYDYESIGVRSNQQATANVFVFIVLLVSLRIMQGFSLIKDETPDNGPDDPGVSYAVPCPERLRRVERSKCITHLSEWLAVRLMQ